MLDTISHDGGILELRLARPPANALDGQLLIALRDAVAAAPADGARGIIVSGSPGMFSAGLDLPLLLDRDRVTMRAFWSDFVGMMRSLAGSTLPIAAAITGHSPAGGAVIALCCDYRVMAAGNFKIGLNEVRVGLPLPAILYDTLVQVVGPRQAALLGAEGRLLDAHQALAAGFVDELAPPEDTVAAARTWLGGVLALPPIAYAQTRARARRALVDALAAAAAVPAIEAIVDAWFSDETQAQLRLVVEQLKAKKR